MDLPMGRDGWSRRAVGLVAAFACLVHANAQHEPSPAPTAAPGRTPAEQKRGTATAPTHAPLPTLHPLRAWRHVQAGNAAAVEALARRRPLPAPAERPAGAGRYVCAVLVCADADVDVAPLLGLHRADVLVIATPGPFASAETVALLERTVTAERLSLLLVLGHADCRAQAGGERDALARRLDAVRAEAARRGGDVPKTLVQLQREHVLAASDLLRERAGDDAFRVLPAVLDPKSGVLTWHHVPTDVMPLAPVK
jgi:carbonic anhydrase